MLSIHLSILVRIKYNMEEHAQRIQLTVNDCLHMLRTLYDGFSCVKGSVKDFATTHLVSYRFFEVSLIKYNALQNIVRTCYQVDVAHAYIGTLKNCRKGISHFVPAIGVS
jgi:hypothetical protein